MDFFKRFLKKTESSSSWLIDGDLVDEYISVLPQCSESVAIASPRYGDKHFTCEVIIPSDDLFVWAENHSQSVHSDCLKTQLARQALPAWLRNSNISDQRLSYLPGSMSNVVRDYVPQFVTGGNSSIFCHECNSLISNITMDNNNGSLKPGWNQWTDRWSCDQGHQLYHEYHETHIYCGS